MYEGHMPDGDPVQKHSAGDLFPIIIVRYGDGTARWVDQRKQRASYRSPQVAGLVDVELSARSYLTIRHCASEGLHAFLNKQYQEFKAEFTG